MLLALIHYYETFSVKYISIFEEMVINTTRKTIYRNTYYLFFCMS
jgi:hypothetical protein